MTITANAATTSSPKRILGADDTCMLPRDFLWRSFLHHQRLSVDNFGGPQRVADLPEALIRKSLKIGLGLGVPAHQLVEGGAVQEGGRRFPGRHHGGGGP